MLSLHLCLLLGILPASAHEPGKTEILAKAQLTTGLRRYEEGRYADAVAAFEAAWRLAPRPELLRHLADAHEAAGDLQPALEVLQRYRSQAPPAEHAALDARLQALRQRLAAEAADARRSAAP